LARSESFGIFFYIHKGVPQSRSDVECVPQMTELPDDLLAQLREPGVHDVSGMDLADKNLRGVHLEHARGLTARRLRGADLRGSSVFNTNFEGADLRRADLSHARGLTQAQVYTMITDESTKLPDGLHPSAPRP
jgi:hypothetical protein